MANFFSKHKLITLLILALLTRVILLGGSLFINNNLSENWIRFDGEWYLDIAKNGYDEDLPIVNPENIVCNQGTGFCQRNFAFFPLYPISISTVHNISGLSYELSGILLSNIAFLGCVYLLYKLSKQLFNSKIAFMGTLLFAVSPLSYIFSAYMSESLFTFLLLLTLLLSINKKYVFAGLVGCLLAATRNTGILVIFPMALIFWKQNKENFSFKNINWKILIGLSLVPIGVVTYALYLWARVGDPLAFIHIQSFWEKPVGGIHPLVAIPFSIFDYTLEGSLKIHLYNLVYFFGAVVLFFVALKKKLLPFYLNSIILWLFVPLLAGSMLALPRYLSVLFPIYLILAKLINNKLLMIFVIFCAAFGLLLLSFFYIQGYWITV